MKRSGHKVKAPGSLADQIIKESTAKPISRVKRQKTGAKKKAYSEITKVLDEQKKLNNEMHIDEKEVNEADMDDLEDDLKEYKLSSAADITSSGDPTDKVLKDFGREMNINMPEEELIFMDFMAEPNEKQRNFLKEIKEQILGEKEDLKKMIDEDMSQCTDGITEDAIKMLQKGGQVLNQFSSDREKLPKLLNFIPRSTLFLKLLFHTSPEKWSAAGMLKMTKVFSRQSDPVARTFYEKILMPRCRDDIAFYKRLNPHLYRALRSAIYKPVAFYEAIILPLCKSRDCSLREAVIFSSVMVKRHIPMIVSMAALKTMTTVTYSGALSIFMQVILNKKYGIPYSMLDTLVDHFCSFSSETRTLPVLWHQSLLTMVQRYRDDFLKEQKERLKGIAEFHTHKKITPEVARELDNSGVRVLTAKPKVTGSVLL